MSVPEALLVARGLVTSFLLQSGGLVRAVNEVDLDLFPGAHEPPAREWEARHQAARHQQRLGHAHGCGFQQAVV